MSRLIVIVVALTTGLAWIVRRLVARPVPPASHTGVGTSPAQEQIWRNAERETIAFRMRSGPGPL
jgi:hypothetical protein